MPERYDHSMNSQLHKIKRQVIELSIASEAEAAPLQAEMRDIQQRQLLPLIDRYCSELGDPERIYRIDTLEIDLGHVVAANLQDDFSARVAGPLRKALAEQIERAEQRAGGDDLAAQSSLELFEFFVRTGSLPWWADTSRPQLLDEVLHRLLESAPGPLARSMRGLSETNGGLKRLVLHYPDALLSRLVLVLLPSLGETLADFFTVIAGFLQGKQGNEDAKHGSRSQSMPLSKQLSELQSIPQAQLWTRVWMTLLYSACREQAPQVMPLRFWREFLRQLALNTNVSYAALATGLYESAQAKGVLTGGLSGSHPFGTIVERLYIDNVESRKEDIVETRNTDIIRTNCSERFEPRNEGISESRNKDVLESRNIDIAKPQIKGDAQILQQTAIETKPLQPNEPAPVDLSFSDADELYLNNAGLVLLWPFLKNFFKHLGLVEEKQFINEAAMQRGVGLLQYIAGADESPAEPLLPLNKVLCGMAPEEVFDFGPAITAQEMEECNDLLVAAIQQAPILHEMSIAGFRGSFLLRKAQLGVSDGHWLLRVERETHDIVLDRFPWGVHIVKLPWMAAMMQVEW